MTMQIIFFGDDYADDFDDPTGKPLKDLDDKDLPFVGWTFKRFEPKDKLNPSSVFQAEGGNKDGDAEGLEQSPSEGDEKKKGKKGKTTVWSGQKKSPLVPRTKKSPKTRKNSLLIFH